jgi:tetratricopeptide (TPR) repeat protein
LGVVMLFGVALEAGSRGGIAALLAGLAIFGLAVRHYGLHKGFSEEAPRAPLLGAAVALGAGALVAALAVTQRTANQLEDTSLGKLAMVSWVRPLLKEHPWLGVGRGAFESAFQRYRIGQNNLVYSHAENFVIQWAAEWGLPVCVLALAALAWGLRPKAVGLRRSAVVLGAFVGVVVLLLQNLVDLGLEVPAIGLAAAVCLGACVGEGARREGEPSSSRYARVWIGASALGLALLLSAAHYGRESLGQARLRLDSALEGADVKSDVVREAFFRDVRRAMLQHPADPYFPRLAAVASLRSGVANPLPWLDRSLELGMRSGRTHYLLARALANWRKTEQALLEFRLAARFDPGLSDRIAEALLEVSRDPQQLARAVPQGPASAKLLLAMTKRLNGLADAELKVQLLRLAARRAPDDVEVHSGLAKLLLTDIRNREDARICRDAQREVCVSDVRRHASELRRLKPHGFEGVEIEARLEMALGDPKAAARRLSAFCPQLERRRPCLLLALSAAVASRDAAQTASVARAAAGQGCDGSDDCGKLYASIADVLIGGGELPLALTYLKQAAQEDGSDERWLRLADVASRASQHGLAVEALTRVRRRRNDPRLLARISAERARAMLPPQTAGSAK